MSIPVRNASLTARPSRISLKASHRRMSLRVSHANRDAGDVNRSQERERYIAPPKRR